MQNTILENLEIVFEKVLTSLPSNHFIQSKEQLESLVNFVNHWNYTRVQKLIIRDYPNVALEYDKYLLQYKYFLLLCVLNQSDIISVPNYGVDMIWHCHLIINKDYNRLTQLINNNQIIYHEPD